VEHKAIYKCSVCGNVVEVLDAKKPPISCCGKPMEKLIASTEDAANEKHVPVVQATDNGIRVVVGSTPHPMTDKHQIVFIEVLTGDDQVYRADLKPGDEPAAEFPINEEDVVEVREYCNIHNLWKT